MIFDDLRGFLEKVKADGDLVELEGVDWNLELGAITELSAEKWGPALLFDKIKDYPPGYRVASNLYETERRLITAMGMPPKTTKLEVIEKWRGRDFRPLQPVEVKTGPVMENVYRGDEVNLLKFPVPKWKEHDGGRYMGTMVVVTTRDPDEGWVNCGVQRVMLYDKNTIGLYISPGKHNSTIRNKYYARGQTCPVVMDFGPEPLLFLSATSHVPWGLSEFDWAGYQRGKPVEVIKGSITGLPFSAHAEIVIEGECQLPEVDSRPEGPFGEWTGYYAGGTKPGPVVKVKALYHRNNPILGGAPPEKPPIISTALPIVTVPTILNNLEGAGISGIKGVWAHDAGGARFITVISIKQDHAGHSKQVGAVAAGCHGGAYLAKLIIVVDDDIDPTDINDVLWAIVTRCDFETQLSVLKGWWGSRLDPSLPPGQRTENNFTHNIMIIDACRPYHWRDKFPLVNKGSPELRAKIRQKWGSRLSL